MLGGTISLHDGDDFTLHGAGPLVLQIRFVYRVDAAGHRSPHFVVHQSWMPLPSEESMPPPSVVDVEALAVPAAGPASDASPSSVVVGGELAPHPLRREAPGSQVSQAPAPQSADGGLSRLPPHRGGSDALTRLMLRGKALVEEASSMHQREADTSIVASVQRLGGDVRLAAEGRDLKLSLYQVSLAVACLSVSKRRSDFTMRDCVFLLFTLEGGCRVRAHNGTLLVYNAGGAWAPFTGVVSSCTVARVKDFMMHVEGIFHQMDTKVKRSRQAVLVVVLDFMHSCRHHTEEDWKRTLAEKCVWGMAPRGRPSQSRGASQMSMALDEDADVEGGQLILGGDGVGEGGGGGGR